MTASVNKVILIGNLGKDPEIRQTQDSKKIVGLSIATSEGWKDKTTGERKEKTEWHRVVIFNDRLAEIAEHFLKKGSKIYIEGQLQTRKWSDNSGIDHFTTEIVLPRYAGEIVMLNNNVTPHVGGDNFSKTSSANTIDDDIDFLF